MAYDAPEFTNEIGSAYLASLLNPIEKQKEVDLANARREGASAGLVGQAATGSRIGAVEEGAARAKSDMIGKFNFDVAGLKRSERLTAEGQAYQSTEAQKSRDFQEKLTKMGYDFADKQREAKRKEDSAFNGAGFATGLLGTAASAGVGGYFGGLGKAAGAAAGGIPGGGVSRLLSGGTQDEMVPDTYDWYERPA